VTLWNDTNLSPAYLSRIPFYIEEAGYISPEIKALVSYGGKKFTTLNETASTSIPPQLIHIPGPHVPRRESISTTPDSQTSKVFEGIVKTYRYEDVKQDSGWVLPADDNYHKRSAGIAHTRSLGFLKKQLDGPWFDLEAVWEEHTKYEFGERDVAKTMATMVDQPYVNHIPTMT
jgi:carboxymethylenebutenolidase